MTHTEATEKARQLLSTESEGAVWLAMIDTSEFLNLSGVARKYFDRSGNWLQQRLHGYKVNGKPATFKPSELQQLSQALRHMAQVLTTSADNIDKTTQLLVIQKHTHICFYYTPSPPASPRGRRAFFCPFATPPRRHTFPAYTARAPPVSRARGVGHWGVEKLTKRTISEPARP